jgi:hypothetical protein
MGAIIINDSDAPGKDPNRRLDTPAGDLDAFDGRITAYLETAKSEALRKSLSAPPPPPGQPWPPVDYSGDIRAEVPAEMYPPVLVASNNESFTDFEGGSGLGYIVSQAFRDAVERLDKDVHQFVPVEVRRKDGGLHDKRPFYYLRVTRLLDAVNLAASPDLPRVAGKPTDPVTETTMFHLQRAPFAIHADRTAGMGLWRDIRAPSLILASERLLELLRERGLTGWRTWSLFDEL